jgi:hypothetical protein
VSILITLEKLGVGYQDAQITRQDAQGDHPLIILKSDYGETT